MISNELLMLKDFGLIMALHSARVPLFSGMANTLNVDSFSDTPGTSSPLSRVALVPLKSHQTTRANALHFSSATLPSGTGEGLLTSTSILWTSPVKTGRLLL